MKPYFLHTLLLVGWMWAICQPLVAQSTLSFSADYLSPQGDLAARGFNDLRGTSLQLAMREGPRILGFEWYNGVRFSYTCAQASRLNFGNGYVLRNHSSGFFLTSRIISPRGKVRVFVEGIAGGQQIFSTQKYINDQFIDPIKEIPHSQFTYAAGVGAGIRINTSQRTALEFQYTRLKGTPTQFVDTQNAQIIGGQVKFPLKESRDSHMESFQFAFVIEMGKIQETRRERRNRLAPTQRTKVKQRCPQPEAEPEPEVEPEVPELENPMPMEKG